MNEQIKQSLHTGLVIPAHPLALTDAGTLDERHQRALTRYYVAAGVGGLAVAVHTTQFAIRDVGLFEPVLTLVREEMDRADVGQLLPLVRIGGVCGPTTQAVREAELLTRLGYHAGLLSLAALGGATDDELIAHCTRVAEVVPVVGFYLQPSVGGRPLSYAFWRRFAEIPRVAAIKIAPFNRYQTLDVVRAVVDAGRDDIALYTGNDDSIVTDLVTPFRFASPEGTVERRIAGGLLGHWAVWTERAAALLAECRAAARDRRVHADLLRKGIEVTDCNAAVFDAANGFGGCIAGIQEVLKRQGLLASTRTLSNESLGRGQAAEIDRVCQAYPHLIDDEFVADQRDTWLRA
jgi:Dihydrodipicolinate synthetase family